MQPFGVGGTSLWPGVFLKVRSHANMNLDLTRLAGRWLTSFGLISLYGAGRKPVGTDIEDSGFSTHNRLSHRLRTPLGDDSVTHSTRSMLVSTVIIVNLLRFISNLSSQNFDYAVNERSMTEFHRCFRQSHGLETC